jgi:hypothetical protein
VGRPAEGPPLPGPISDEDSTHIPNRPFCGYNRLDFAPLGGHSPRVLRIDDTIGLPYDQLPRFIHYSHSNLIPDVSPRLRSEDGAEGCLSWDGFLIRRHSSWPADSEGDYFFDNDTFIYSTKAITRGIEVPNNRSHMPAPSLDLEQKTRPFPHKSIAQFMRGHRRSTPLWPSKGPEWPCASFETFRMRVCAGNLNDRVAQY